MVDLACAFLQSERVFHETMELPMTCPSYLLTYHLSSSQSETNSPGLASPWNLEYFLLEPAKNKHVFGDVHDHKGVAQLEK